MSWRSFSSVRSCFPFPSPNSVNFPACQHALGFAEESSGSMSSSSNFPSWNRQRGFRVLLFVWFYSLADKTSLHSVKWAQSQLNLRSTYISTGRRFQSSGHWNFTNMHHLESDTGKRLILSNGGRKPGCRRFENYMRPIIPVSDSSCFDQLWVSELGCGRPGAVDLI